MNSQGMPSKVTYVGLFMIALATVMYEILLTRIFSVVMWYHFAFVAISVAMFGMTVGAIIVYLRPNLFTQERAVSHLAMSSLFFAVSIIFSFLTFLCIPFVEDKSFMGLYSIALIYGVISIPFIFSGICVCLALTKFPARVSRLYAADLCGSATACILLVFALRITDGPTAVFVVAFISGLGSLFFSFAGPKTRIRTLAAVVSLLLIGFSVFHTILVRQQSPVVTLRWVKEKRELPCLYEKWNSFSRIKVFGDPTEERDSPFGGGRSITLPAGKFRYLHLNIDASAATALVNFDGDLSKVAYLKYEICNLAHYLRSDARVLVIGSGGGREILSALVFGQKEVLGVEINQDIIKTVNDRFGDYTGHLDLYPNVKFVCDEARSYITRSPERFDIIQATMIDTWSATSSGAYVLTENSLYTLEAWRVFLEHLTEEGILSFTRWYFRDRPGEVYRLTSLATQALREIGVQDPRQHILIARRMWPSGNGYGTILISKKPFSKEDIGKFEQVVETMQFEPVLTPRYCLDTTFAALSSAEEIDNFVADYPLDISAPRDDSPFFFNMLRLRHVLNYDLSDQGITTFNMRAVFVLAALSVTVAGFSLVCIIVPLILTTRRDSLKGSLPSFLFFMGIGFGFMLVEVSQMQRLILFLGHPTYGLSVVLFALLLSSGFGSFSTQRVRLERLFPDGFVRLLALLCVLLIFGVITPHILSAFRGETTMYRIIIAVLILLPLGFFMGMAFPLGMKAASGRMSALTPWFWGINGACSVCASVLAIVIALVWGISAAFWVGFALYIIASLSFLWVVRNEKLQLQANPQS